MYVTYYCNKQFSVQTNSDISLLFFEELQKKVECVTANYSLALNTTFSIPTLQKTSSSRKNTSAAANQSTA
jgi:hypothetical protein